jgi:hypothetical protein
MREYIGLMITLIEFFILNTNKKKTLIRIIKSFNADFYDYDADGIYISK